MPSVIVFDPTDQPAYQLSPLNDLRPVFDVRTGALTTLERIAKNHAVAGLIVPQHLATVTEQNHPRLPVNSDDHGTVMLLNGACPLPPQLPAAGSCLVDDATNQLIAVHAEAAIARRAIVGDLGALRVDRVSTIPLMTRPWHVRSNRDACILADLALYLADNASSVWAAKAPAGVTVIGDSSRVRISASAKISPTVILDAETGPIVIDAHAVVRPGSSIIGPAYLGQHSTVLDRALIKANTAIGPHCKVAGEVGGTIFQGFANKAHDGHLGDAYVGEWANLGAGTTNSNLLNTYAEVIARPFDKSFKPASNERTGQQFLGAIIGDHVKTAICTRIMTGAIVGTGTMFAATGPLSGTVSPMSWITDASARAFRFDKFMEVAAAAMSRRKLSPSPAYTNLILHLSNFSQ